MEGFGGGGGGGGSQKPPRRSKLYTEVGFKLFGATTDRNANAELGLNRVRLRFKIINPNRVGPCGSQNRTRFLYILRVVYHRENKHGYQTTPNQGRVMATLYRFRKRRRFLNPRLG